MEVRVRAINIVKDNVIAIDRERMLDMMETLSDTTPKEGYGMLCLALSVLYRSGFDDEVTMVEFTDAIGRQVRALIDNPPEDFKEEPATPDCDCDVCEEKRARVARAH